MTRERIGVNKNFATVADDVQLGVVAAAVLASLDRHVLAHEPDRGREESGSGHETEM